MGGVGLYKPVTLSAALSKVTGISGKTTRGQAIKALWGYIKKKNLNKGRNVGKIEGIWNGGSMFRWRARWPSTSSERMRFLPRELLPRERGALRLAVIAHEGFGWRHPQG